MSEDLCGRIERRLLDDRHEILETGHLVNRPIEPPDSFAGDAGTTRVRVHNQRVPRRDHVHDVPASVGSECVTGVIAPMTPNGAYSVSVTP